MVLATDLCTLLQINHTAASHRLQSLQINLWCFWLLNKYISTIWMTNIALYTNQGKQHKTLCCKSIYVFRPWNATMQTQSFIMPLFFKPFGFLESNEHTLINGIFVSEPTISTECNSINGRPAICPERKRLKQAYICKQIPSWSTVTLEYLTALNIYPQCTVSHKYVWKNWSI